MALYMYIREEILKKFSTIKQNQIYPVFQRETTVD